VILGDGIVLPTLSIPRYEQWLTQAAEQDTRVQRLRTHHGIGVLTGLCLVHTLATVERFANSRKVTTYVGFDPVEDSTGERHRMGSISKQGSRMLRMSLVEAAQVARRRDPELDQVWISYFRATRRTTGCECCGTMLSRACSSCSSGGFTICISCT
jgi:hypothetical protein